MDNFVDLEDVPYDTKEFMLPDAGLCQIRIKPHENAKDGAFAYITRVKREEVCVVDIFRPHIYSGELSDNDKAALVEFLKSYRGYEIAGRRIREFDSICNMWSSKNIQENDDPIEIPDEVTDYTKIP